MAQSSTIATSSPWKSFNLPLFLENRVRAPQKNQG
jgi:hypothetical protein